MKTVGQKSPFSKVWKKLARVGPYCFKKIILVRRPLTLPICSLLIRLNINQTQVSLFRLLLLTGFGFLWISQKYNWSLLILAAFYFMDWIDGDLSRALKHDNDLGKFEDVTIDNVAVIVCPFVFIWQQLIPGLLGAVYIFLVTQAWWMSVIRRNLVRKSDWVLHAYAGAPLHFLRFWVVPFLLFLYAFWGIDWFTPVIVGLSILLALHLVYDYYLIIRNRLHNRE